jgi:hypothetical protein
MAVIENRGVEIVSRKTFEPRFCYGEKGRSTAAREIILKKLKQSSKAA